MLKVVAVAFLSTALIAEAAASGSAEWRPVAKALAGIPSAAGVSVLDRIDRCNFTVVKDKSFVETRSTPWAQYDAKAGQTVLKVTIQLPLYKGEPPADNAPMEAVWVLDHGKATALSHWAILLQTKSIPMGYDKRLNC